MSTNNGIPLLWLQIMSFLLLVASAYFDLMMQDFAKPLPEWWYWSLVGVIFSETAMGKAITVFVIETYEQVFKKSRRDNDGKS